MCGCVVPHLWPRLCIPWLGPRGSKQKPCQGAWNATLAFWRLRGTSLTHLKRGHDISTGSPAIKMTDDQLTAVPAASEECANKVQTNSQYIHTEKTPIPHFHFFLAATKYHYLVRALIFHKGSSQTDANCKLLQIIGSGRCCLPSCACRRPV